ncbi:MAG: DUF3822 family protein [Bacteroidales bacterium]|nr:DUF3822 family protein [Bacteroidales bacterium]
MPLSIKPHISFLDKSFKENNTRSYVMAMQLNLHGLAFVLFYPEKNKVIGLQTYRFEGKKQASDIPMLFDLILNQAGWFAYPYQKVYFLTQNNFNTMIPLPLFDKDNKNLYLGFNQPFQEDHRIVYDQLKNVETANVYYLANPVAEKVKEFWPNVGICHYSTALVESLMVGFKNKLNTHHLFLDVHEDNFDLVTFKDNKLYYYNNFAYHTQEDFIYFLLSTIEHLSLNPETVQLIMMGGLDKSNPKYEMIYRYIRHSEFIQRNENIQYSHVLENVLHHQFYTLYNVLQCEL